MLNSTECYRNKGVQCNLKLETLFIMSGTNRSMCGQILDVLSQLNCADSIGFTGRVKFLILLHGAICNQTQVQWSCISCLFVLKVQISDMNPEHELAGLYESPLKSFQIRSLAKSSHSKNNQKSEQCIFRLQFPGLSIWMLGIQKCLQGKDRNYGANKPQRTSCSGNAAKF